MSDDVSESALIPTPAERLGVALDDWRLRLLAFYRARQQVGDHADRRLPRLAISVPGGIEGDAVVRTLARLLREAEAEGLGRLRARYAVGTHARGDEVMQQLRRHGLNAGQHFGYDWPDPLRPRRPMCPNVRGRKAVRKLGYDLMRTLCRWCRSRGTCGTLRQIPELAGRQVVVCYSEFLFKPLAQRIGEFDLTIADQSFFALGMRTLEVALTEFETDLTRWGVLDEHGERDPAATEELRELRRRLAAVLRALLRGEFLSRAAIRAAEQPLNLRDCNRAIELEEARKVKGAITEGMTLDEMEAAADDAPNSRLDRYISLWQWVRALLQSGDADTGRIQGWLDGVIRLNGLRDFSANVRDNPILHLDPHGEEWVLDRFSNWNYVKIEAPSEHTVIRVPMWGGRNSADPDFTNDKDAQDRRQWRLDQLRRLVIKEAKGEPARLVIEGWQVPYFGSMGPHIDVRHHGEMAGLRGLSPVRRLFVLMDPAWRDDEIQRGIACLTGEAIPPPRHTRQEIEIRMREGPPDRMTAMRYPGEEAASLKRAVTDAAIWAAIDSAGRDAEVWLMGSALAEAIPHDRVVEVVETPGWLRRMIREGVVLTSPGDAFRAFGGGEDPLFPSEAAARQAFRRAFRPPEKLSDIFGEEKTEESAGHGLSNTKMSLSFSGWAEWRYRRPGNGQREARAFFEAGGVGPEKWLRARFGEVRGADTGRTWSLGD